MDANIACYFDIIISYRVAGYKCSDVQCFYYGYSSVVMFLGSTTMSLPSNAEGER